MMVKNLTYKGFAGSAETSVEDECLHGRLLFIDDIITYEGETIPDLRRAFEAAVERYVEYCKANGKAPQKACSGVFQVRVSPELHRLVVMKAHETDRSLNEFVEGALTAATSSGQKVVHEHHVVFEELQAIGGRIAGTTRQELAWETYGNQRPH